MRGGARRRGAGPRSSPGPGRVVAAVVTSAAPEPYGSPDPYATPPPGTVAPTRAGGPVRWWRQAGRSLAVAGHTTAVLGWAGAGFLLVLVAILDGLDGGEDTLFLVLALVAFGLPAGLFGAVLGVVAVCLLVLVVAPLTISWASTGRHRPGLALAAVAHALVGTAAVLAAGAALLHRA